MATIEMKHLHHTTRDDAAIRARRLIEAFKRERALLVNSLDWSDDGLRGIAKGKGFKGIFQITDTAIVVSIDLGFLIRPLKGKVISSLTERLSGEFEKSAAS
jgi:hypothetical protein